MKLKDYVWPVIGLAAVGISVWLLYRELRSISLDDVIHSLYAIPVHRWILAGFSSLVAYAALAGYDRIALLHLRRKISWVFIALCSFTTYALSHNIGASVLSGAVVRYRAYSSQGMSGPEIALLIAFCSFTFMLGVLTLSAVVLLVEPDLLAAFQRRSAAFLELRAGFRLALAIVIAVCFWQLAAFPAAAHSPLHT